MEHAYWIFKQIGGLRKFKNICSNCKWGIIDDYRYFDIDSFNYCPHCGAKMDEENKQWNIRKEK